MTPGEVEAELPPQGHPATEHPSFVETARAKLTRLFDADLTQRRPFAILALFFYLARLPYINEGYGTDLRWTLLVDEPAPDEAVIGRMRYRINVLINANLRYSFGQ